MNGITKEYRTRLISLAADLRHPKALDRFTLCTGDIWCLVSPDLILIITLLLSPPEEQEVNTSQSPSHLNHLYINVYLSPVELLCNSGGHK